MELNLCSGGLDSYLAWKLFCPKAINVFVDIGHKYALRERAAIGAIKVADAEFRCTDVKGAMIGRYELPSGIIPLRNAHLVLAALSAFGPRAEEAGDTRVEVTMGVLRGEQNSDKSELFMLLLSRLLNECWRPQYWTEHGLTFSVYSPLRQLTKSEAVLQYVNAGHHPRALFATRSCYADAMYHCGQCPSCVKRALAFSAAGVRDMTYYMVPPLRTDLAAEIGRKAADGQYDPARTREVLDGLAAAAKEAR